MIPISIYIYIYICMYVYVLNSGFWALRVLNSSLSNFLPWVHHCRRQWQPVRVPPPLPWALAQFQAHGLNFLGLQETRTDTASWCQNQVRRLAGGRLNGQLGVEIWVNLDQPYAHKAGRPCRCRRSDFVVVSHSPTHLLVHLLNADLDLWLSSAHAPHSGTALHEREEWWHQLTETVHS